MKPDVVKTTVASRGRAGLRSALKQLMAQPSALGAVLWAFPAIIQVAISVSMLSRRLWRDMPIFFTYLIWQVGSSAVLYGVYARGLYRPYFYSYWVADVISSVLVFVVIRELYGNVFGQYDRLDQISGMLFVWASILLAVVGTVTAAAATGDEPSRILKGVLAFDMASSILSGGLILLLFVMSSMLQLRWKDAFLGVAIGFALFATVDLIGSAWRIHIGQPYPLISVIRNFFYSCATIVWVVYCLRRQREVLMPGAVRHSDLERWNRELAQFI